jgi:hypothetical protein
MAYSHFQFRVTVLEEGALQIAPTPLPIFPTRRFEPVGEGLFQADDGSFATFREDDGRITHLLFNPSGVLPMAFERIAEWRSAGVQLALIVLFAAGWPAVAMALSVALWRRWLFESALKRTALLALLAALANTAFLTFPATTGQLFFGEDLGLPTFLSSPRTPPLYFGPNLLMLAVLALPLVALALQTIVALRVARAWWNETDLLGARAALTALVLFGTGFALFLNEWNLLGYRL